MGILLANAAYYDTMTGRNFFCIAYVTHRYTELSWAYESWCQFDSIRLAAGALRVGSPCGEFAFAL